jgi:predicted dehydrogenase
MTTTRDRVRWGILGAGNIAGSFAEGLQVLPDAALVAVGSRSQEKAAAFAARFGGGARAHGSYEELASDPDVDAVYVATPHTFHLEHTLLALAHGKAVLCEKPFALNLGEAEVMVAEARARHLFLMEAMWTRLLPHVERAVTMAQEGALGEVRQLTADFGFRAAFDPRSRLFDPALGGGGLLDVGVYPLWLAQAVFGEPEEVAAFARLGETGVDEEISVLLRYPGGQTAALQAANRLQTPHEATIIGTEGYLRLLPSWWRPSHLVFHRPGRDPERLEVPSEGNGYNYEAAEVGRCLRAGRLESDRLPLASTLSVMRTMDRIRAAIGLTYPQEAL